MDYIQTSNYWGNSYWGGGYWGDIGATRHSEIFRVNLVMNLSVLSLGLLVQAVPTAQLINFSVVDTVVLNMQEETDVILNKLVSDTYDELEKL